MKTAFDTIDWNQEELKENFINLNIDPIFEGLVSGTIKSLDPAQVISLGMPPSSCFFQYNDLDPDRPAQVGVYCRSLAYHVGDIAMLKMINVPAFDVLQMDVMVATEQMSAYPCSAYAVLASEKGEVTSVVMSGKPYHPLPDHIATVLAYPRSAVFQALEKCPQLAHEILEPYQCALQTATYVLVTNARNKSVQPSMVPQI